MLKIQIEQLKKDSINLRKELIDISATEVGCHLGGSLSVIDILYAAYKYFYPLEIVLSKGHTSAALYSVLYQMNLLDKKPSLEYGKKTSLLTGHPNHQIDNITFSTGSLGHGLPYGIGMALANKIQRNNDNVIIIGGDGELQEGLIWETLQIASAKSIHNFIYIVDINGGQNDGTVDDISPYFDLRSRFASYGFDTKVINGHSYDDLIDCFKNKDSNNGLIILAHTIKGKGIKRLENNPSSHYVKINSKVADNWKKELG